MVEWHTPRLSALAAAGPDLFAFETLPSLVDFEPLLFNFLQGRGEGDGDGAGGSNEA